MNQHVQLRKRKNRSVTWVGAILALIFSVFDYPLHGGTIRESRHDLSTENTANVCIFRHCPHNANPDVAAPLWNRAGTPQTFTVYTSDTIYNPPGQPSPAHPSR